VPLRRFVLAFSSLCVRLVRRSQMVGKVLPPKGYVLVVVVLV